MQGTEFVWMQGTAFRVKSGGFRGGIRECRERDSGSNLWVSGYAGEFVKHLLGFREFRGFGDSRGFRGTHFRAEKIVFSNMFGENDNKNAESL